MRSTSSFSLRLASASAMAGFSKIYDGSVRAVDAVAMEIRRGEFLFPARPLGLWQDHAGDRRQKFSFNLVVPRGDHPSKIARRRRPIGGWSGGSAKWSIGDGAAAPFKAAAT
jgi:hypothetical protein